MPPELSIQSYIGELPGWQRANLEMFRRLIHEAEPAVQEAWKWNVPVFQKGGSNIVAMSAFKDHTKFNFFQGAALSDPGSLFNSGLESVKSRGIDLHEGETVNRLQLEQLLRSAFGVL